MLVLSTILSNLSIQEGWSPVRGSAAVFEPLLLYCFLSTRLDCLYSFLSTSVEAALKWNLAILICQHLHLPLTTRFLENCARDDRWLPFVWFAQLHQYPKSQVCVCMYVRAFMCVCVVCV